MPTLDRATHCSIPGLIGHEIICNTSIASLLLLSFISFFLFLLSYLLLPGQLLKVPLEPLVICCMHRFSLRNELLLQVNLLLDPLAIVRFDVSLIVMLALA